MSIEQVEERMSEMLDDLESLNATVKFVCKNDGVIFLDATETPAVLSHEDDMADCTIKITTQNLEKLLAGKLDPMLAYTMGKLKVKGSMGIAMKLTGLLH
ncbi:Sterol-binding protein [Candidatus Terasakiella magnetica]|uniref:Sterol-binding protein n=1 Tax=Candidatus Terasakiella magnetica TaxID=1867952 RepID=A0A1C3RBV1_9PROT|nr:SCP2 sterol-binding domain-containing protein [Candidatus Terasakiella magnetica]SCA54757.1 Sterol-binding protein [Candidatus Terasakiella magnetica]